MATLTASAAVAGAPARSVHAGVNSITVNYDNSSTSISADSLTTILMAKIPHGASILDVQGVVSSGAATCPFTLGISGNNSAFATAGTVNTILRATKGLPYDVSVSDDTATQYIYVTMAVQPGTATTDVEGKMTVIYTMDR